MLGIRRFYNQNRRTIWISIIVFIFIIAILQILNSFFKNDNSSSTKNSATTINNNYSIITNSKVEKNKAEKINKIIDDFFTYCNNGKISNAYNLLSSNCKNELYPTEEIFKNEFTDKMFKTKKIYSSQAWISNDIGYTYRIDISEDILSSGKSNYNSTEEYFTIVEEDNDYKLNINNYIGTEEINKTVVQNNIEINVISKQIYQTYEKYKISVKNNTENSIALDGFRNSNSVYLLDNRGGKKLALLNELSIQELLVKRNLSLTKEIKFDRVYNTDLRISTLVFEDIILDYNKYIKGNKKDYKDTLKIEINI